MTRTVVRANGLTKRYGSFTAVEAVDFTLEENRIYGLLGRNGAGKTTIMQLLTGQLFPNGGDLEVYGRAPAEHPTCCDGCASSPSRSAIPTPSTHRTC
jgi:ABC-2 type transport system ATP-binding protein